MRFDDKGMKDADVNCVNPTYKFNVSIKGRVVGYVIAVGIADAMDKAKSIFGSKAEI